MVWYLLFIVFLASLRFHLFLHILHMGVVVFIRLSILMHIAEVLESRFSMRILGIIIGAGVLFAQHSIRFHDALKASRIAFASFTCVWMALK